MTVLSAAEKSIPKLGSLGNDLFVPFKVRKYKKSEVLWLNERWLLENNINIFNPDIRNDIVNWLLTEYGVGCRTSEQPSKQFVGKTTTMYADRYGGTNGTPQGGSGRCGTRGNFNAKGIGKTPLVSEFVDSGHKNGFLPLAEALCEVIFSEIANGETPYGSIPVLAILSTGHKHEFQKENGVEACAIVVRSNFVRPAHFERSIFFGDSGTKCSQQYLDAKRVQSAITTAQNASAINNIQFNNLEEIFLKFATQIGSCHANRLWSGQFLSSNMSVCGAFVDFGSFRSVYSWQRAVGLSSQIFGREGTSIRSAYKSLKFNFDKFSAKPQIRRKSFFDEFENLITHEIEHSFLNTNFPINNKSSRKSAKYFAKLMLEYFQHQQKLRYHISMSSDWTTRRPWLLHALENKSKTKYPYDTIEQELSKEIENLVFTSANKADVAPDLAMASLVNWFKPRPSLFHENITRKTKLISKKIKLGKPENSLRIKNFINSSIARNRRSWTNKPQNFHISAQSSDGTTFALFGYYKNYDKKMVWLHGHIIDNQAILFGQFIPLKLIEKQIKVKGFKYNALISYISNKGSPEVFFGDIRIKLQPPMFKY